MGCGDVVLSQGLSPGLAMVDSTPPAAAQVQAPADETSRALGETCKVSETFSLGPIING